MKILFCFFDDFFSTTCLAGGITGHAENLAWGFRELGHTVDCVVFRRAPGTIVYKDSVAQRFRWLDTSAFEIPLNTNLGWCFRENQHYTLDSIGVDRFRNLSGDYDIVVWELMKLLSGRNYNTFANQNVAVYQNNAKSNLSVAHIGSALRNKSWKENTKFMDDVSVFGTKFVGVHPFATNTLAEHLKKRTIFNPFGVVQQQGVNWVDRVPGFLAASRFVSSKQIDQILRSVCYMDQATQKFVAGDGFERYRMLKALDDPTMDPRYIASQLYDPDLPDELVGRRIWDNALDYGFQWLKKINQDVRDQHLRTLRATLDASCIKATVKYGEIFHRVTVDPMIFGAIPIRVYMPEEDCTNHVFKPGINYVGVPYGVTPKEFAGIVDSALRDVNQANKILQNNEEVLKLFDRRTIAQQYINYAKEV